MGKIDAKNTGLSNNGHKSNGHVPSYEAYNDLPANKYYADRDFLSMPRSPNETLEPSRANEPPEQRPNKPKKPQNSFLNFTSFLFSLFVVSCVGLGLMYVFARYEYNAKGPLAYSKVITIPKGEGVYAISKRLKKENIISSELFFKIAARTTNAEKKLQAGEFEFPAKASLKKVLNQLAHGKAILYSVSLPEGLTSQQMVGILRASDQLSGDIQSIPSEGSLLPDTYRFSRGTNRVDIIKRMQSSRAKLVKNLWVRRSKNLPFKNPEEAVILASIVEKETGRAGERARIAGVFLNRLKKGMRLQSDPTIIYGLVGGKGKLGRGIRKSEIAKKTPYNTYQINGLPPTPIANPGKAALEAVFSPEDNDYYYFVANGKGGHYFASTLKEHNENVLKWRKVEAERLAEKKRIEAVRIKQEEDKAEATKAELGDEKPSAPKDKKDIDPIKE